MVHIAIVTSADIVRGGIEKAISKSSDISIRFTSTTLEECKPLLNQHQPDIVILDIQTSGIPSAQELRDFTVLCHKNGKRIEIIILTDFTNQYRHEYCQQLGIKGFCLRNITYDRFIESIKTVARSNEFVHEDYEKMVSRTQKRLHGLEGSLTKRHVEVLNLMMWGLSNIEIAELLHISVPTVKAHVKVILRALQARDRTQAISNIFQDMLVTEEKDKHTYS